MSKIATLKDVLYGLEYGNQELCRWPSTKSPSWSLEPSGVKVPHHVADKVREAPEVVRAPSTRFGEDRYVWQRRAA